MLNVFYRYGIVVFTIPRDTLQVIWRQSS